MVVVGMSKTIAKSARSGCCVVAAARRWRVFGSCCPSLLLEFRSKPRHLSTSSFGLPRESAVVSDRGDWNNNSQQQHYYYRNPPPPQQQAASTPPRQRPPPNDNNEATNTDKHHHHHHHHHNNNPRSSNESEDVVVVLAAHAMENGIQLKIRSTIHNHPHRPRGEVEEECIFHTPWLWANDPQYIHPSSGQRTRSARTHFGWKVRSATIFSSPPPHQAPSSFPPKGSFHPVGTVYQLESSEKEGQIDDADDKDKGNLGCLQIDWHNASTDEQCTSFFDLAWLLQCRYDEAELERRKEASTIWRKTALRKDEALLEVDFKQWRNNPEETSYQLLQAIFDKGAALITNAPCHFTDDDDADATAAAAAEEEYTVGAIGKSLSGGSLSHGSLYGEIFHVEQQSATNTTNNVAYTNMPLPPHQDLAYYESKPGLQLLHCVKNQGVTGGSSVLIDALAAAEWFKQIEPHFYRVLLDCEATFIKQRNNADMIYRRPHIEEDSRGSVIRVNWSPPFEGPLCIHPDSVEDYYLAYAAFERLLDHSLPADRPLLLPILPYSLERDLVEYAQRFTWERTLKRGDLLIFSNARMLHGRRGFEISSNNDNNSDNNNGRHLVGCYTNIDDTMNHYRLLRRRYCLAKQKTTMTTPSYLRLPGNGSSSTM